MMSIVAVRDSLVVRQDIRRVRLLVVFFQATDQLEEGFSIKGQTCNTVWTSSNDIGWSNFVPETKAIGILLTDLTATTVNPYSSKAFSPK